MHQELLRLAAAVDCLDGASGPPSHGAAGGGAPPDAGAIGEELADAISAVQDVWRGSQTMLGRVDALLNTSDGVEGDASGANGASRTEAGAGDGGGGFAEDAAEFFAKEAESGSCCCADCGACGVTWASVSHGVYLCVDCAGAHRGLGVHLSFVRSTQIDRWTSAQLRRMRLGGQARFSSFLDGYPQLAGNFRARSPSSLKRRYGCRAARFYRQQLEAKCKNLPPPEQQPAPSEGHLGAEMSAAERQGHSDRMWSGDGTCAQRSP